MAMFVNLGRCSYIRLAPDVIIKPCISATLFSHRRTQSQSKIPGIQYLFTEAAMGIDGYVYHREKAAIQFQNLQDKFRERMSDVLKSDSKNMIFTEDLKNAVHIAKANEDDMSLVIEMAKKFNLQHSGLRFGEYIFGPVIMRMFHHLNQPDAALKALKTDSLEGFFDQLSSYQIALNLLYKNGRYQDALDLFRELQEKRLSGVKYPKNCLTIALACCYKMNTEESYKTMMEIFEGLEDYGSSVNLRSISFSAALALRQNNPHIALELLSRLHSAKSKVVRNLKVLALVELGKIEDTIPIFRSVLQFDLPETHLPLETLKFLRETITKAEAAVEEIKNMELTAEFQHVLKGLDGSNLISDQTLDDIVCEPIHKAKQNQGMQQDRAMLAAAFNRNSRNQRQFMGRNRRRVGLTEME